jgi:hypothetical protein
LFQLVGYLLQQPLRHWTLPIIFTSLFVALIFVVISFIYAFFLQYFKLKKMTKEQIAIFIAEHKWDYQCGFKSFRIVFIIVFSNINIMQFLVLLLHF